MAPGYVAVCRKSPVGPISMPLNCHYLLLLLLLLHPLNGPLSRCIITRCMNDDDNDDDLLKIATLKPVFENTYFMFFSDLKKNMTFYVFLK